MRDKQEVLDGLIKGSFMVYLHHLSGGTKLDIITIHSCNRVIDISRVSDRLILGQQFSKTSSTATARAKDFNRFEQIMQLLLKEAFIVQFKN